MDAFVKPRRLYTRSEVLARPSPVPREPGLYGWFFREVPPGVPADGCIGCGDFTLLYVGICPGRPPAPGTPRSRRTLRDRIRDHMAGTARRSTLRRTLGCLLADELGLELQRKGDGKFWFAEGEARLSRWLDDHAAVVWAEHPRPWEVEPDIIRTLPLPLNLQHNAHPFVEPLKRIRSAARDRARALPVARGAG